MPSVPIDIDPTESDQMPHLAERVVLLLQPLQATLLGHGETLKPARTETAPAETLARSYHPHARGCPIGDPQLLKVIQSGPIPPMIGWGQSSSGIELEPAQKRIWWDRWVGRWRGGNRGRIGGRVPQCEGKEKESRAQRVVV